MNAKQLLEVGQLSAAIEQLNQDVRSHPADSHLRTFLFELLCFAGQYERASQQLEVIGSQSVTAEVGVAVYGRVLTAEIARSRLFSDGLAPAFLLDPPAYIKLHLEAIAKLRENRPQEACDLVAEAAKLRPALQGRLDKGSFESFRDSDDLLSPVLEVLLPDTYLWVPFDQIRSVHISAAKKLRDLIWIPARLECCDGITREVFLPVLYIGSSQHPDDRVKLGRMTDWTPLGQDGLLHGIGQRIFLVGADERPILEMRDMEFDDIPLQGIA